MLGAQIFTIAKSSSQIDPFIIMQCPSLALVRFFNLRSIFSDMRIPTLLSFASHLHGIYFPFSHFQCICIFRSEVDFLQTAYIWVIFLYPLVSLCLLVGAFNLITFKAITDIYIYIYVSIAIPKKGNARECSNYCTIALISQASKVMLKILQVRLQQYINCELPDVQAGFRKGRGTRDQIANIRQIMEKAREFQKKTSIYALLTMPKPLTVWITINCGKF